MVLALLKHWFLLRYLNVKIPCYRFAVTIYADWLKGCRNSHSGLYSLFSVSVAEASVMCQDRLSHSWSLRHTKTLPSISCSRSSCAHCLVEGKNMHHGCLLPSPGKRWDARGLPSCSHLGGSQLPPPPGFPRSWSGVPLRLLAEFFHLHPGLQFFLFILAYFVISRDSLQFLIDPEFSSFPPTLSHATIFFLSIFGM